MSRSSIFSVVLAALAPALASLLGQPGAEFVGSGRRDGPSAGNQRAAAELARHRSQWANTPDTSVWTRQRRRQAARLAAKGRAS